MDRDQTIYEFRKMWRWYSKHPDRYAEEYLEKYQDGKYKELLSSSFLCDYANRGVTEWNELCKDCPIQWVDKNGKPVDKCLNSIYRDWKFAKKTHGKRGYLAKIISKLEVKGENNA